MPRKKKDTSNYWMKLFPERLRQLMEEKGVKQPQIADYLGISAQAVSNYCLGKSSPDWEGIVSLAQYFNVSSDYLLGLSNRKVADLKVKEICDYTNLSEKAVTNLAGMKNHTASLWALESIIGNDVLLDLLGMYFTVSDDITIELHDRRKMAEHIALSVEIQTALIDLRRAVRKQMENGIYPGCDVRIDK